VRCARKSLPAWAAKWALKAGQDLKKKGRRGQSKQGENMLKSSKK